MPRIPDVPCNRCGKLMWRGTGVLPEGRARCQPCRRDARAALVMMCPWCWQTFKPSGRHPQTFCTVACARKSQGERQRVRAPDDQHQQRCERAKNAPGLSISQRSKLLTRWKRQGKTCAYCDALATTVDHVVPLVRGGTNYEGNLVPACRPCNSRKSFRLVIEWRTGKRIPRMTSPLVWMGRSSHATEVRIVRPALRGEAA